MPRAPRLWLKQTCLAPPAGARRSLQPLKPSYLTTSTTSRAPPSSMTSQTTPSSSTVSNWLSNAPAQLRRAYVPVESIPHLSPAVGCSGCLATTRNHVRSLDRWRQHFEQPRNRWPRQDYKREYAEQCAVWHTQAG